MSDEFLHRYAEACFAPGDVTFGYFVDGVLRGAGELRRLGPSGRASPLAAWAPVPNAEGEFAFSVEAAFRRRGIGHDLMSRLLRAAANRGMGKLTLTCLAQNHAMQSLARGFGADLQFEACNVTGRLVARRPTPFSVWGEAFETAAGIAGGFADLQRSAMARRAAA